MAFNLDDYEPVAARHMKNKKMKDMTEIVIMHNERMQEMVVALNQIIDSLGKTKDFVNGLAERVNSLNEGLMELARQVYKEEESL